MMDGTFSLFHFFTFSLLTFKFLSFDTTDYRHDSDNYNN